MSTAAGNSLPVASGARHRDKLAALMSLGLVASLAISSAVYETIRAGASDDTATSFVASDRGAPVASRSAAPAGSGVVPVSNGRDDAPFALVSGRPMFPLSGSGVFASWQPGSPVEAHDVPVQSLTPSGFWMGFDEFQRVFVTIPNSAVENGSLSLAQLQPGQMVNVSGRVGELPDNVGSLDLEDPALRQLTRQGKLVEANNVRLP